MSIDIYGNCPECEYSWDAGEIPEAKREHYSPPYRWSSLIGIEYLGEYDGVSEWMCPSCSIRWDRFTGEKSERPVDLVKGVHP